MHPPSLRAIAALWAEHALWITTGETATETTRVTEPTLLPGDAAQTQFALVTPTGDVATLSLWHADSDATLSADELAQRFARAGTPLGVCGLDRVSPPTSNLSIVAIARSQHATARIDAPPGWVANAPHPLPRPGTPGQLSILVPRPPPGAALYVLDASTVPATFQSEGVVFDADLSVADPPRLTAPRPPKPAECSQSAAWLRLRCRVEGVVGHEAHLAVDADAQLELGTAGSIPVRLVRNGQRCGILIPEQVS